MKSDMGGVHKEYFSGVYTVLLKSLFHLEKKSCIVWEAKGNNWMLVGYARTSTADQVVGYQSQIKNLKNEGCER